MSWFSRHPYAAVCAAAGMLIIVGALVVESRTATAPGTLSVWGGTGTPLLNPTSYTPSEIVSSRPSVPSGQGKAPIFIPPAQGQDTQSTAEPGGDSFDFDSFLAQLSQSPGQKSTTTAVSENIGLAYSFIPSGLIATSTPERVLTEDQQRIFNYGNDAASYIQTYEDSNSNASVALRDQAEDRQNAQKMQAVKLVASGMRTAGESLLGMEELPSGVSGIHKALAESYIEAGRQLAKVPDANGDEAFVAAIAAYNSAADGLVKNYIALATFFSVSGITFSPQDPGSIFTFSAGGGL